MTEPPRLPTSLRPLLVLELLAAAAAPMSPAEIGRRLSLPKQTAHRLCQTLLAEGFVAPEDGGRKLRVGARGRAMGAGLLHGPLMHVARRQILVQVAAAVRETVNFVVPDAAGMVYADRVETDWPFRVQLPVGSHVPFHCTASGKTYLASLSGDRRGKVIAALPLERHTAKTLTEPERLAAAVDEVARQGYATDDEEFFDGMVAIAVPITAPGGAYAGALAFHGPTQRLTLDLARERLPLLLDGAARLRGVLFDG